MNRIKKITIKHRIITSICVIVALGLGYLSGVVFEIRPREVTRVEFKNPTVELVRLNNGLVLEVPFEHLQAYPEEVLKEIFALALNMYHEARGECLEGIYAVGYVTINRLKNRQFPSTIEEVVYQKGINSKGKLIHQFSWTNKSKNGMVPKDKMAWKQILLIAETVYRDEANIYNPVKGFNYYARDYIINRGNLLGLRNITERKKIGSHIFLKVKE